MLEWILPTPFFLGLNFWAWIFGPGKEKEKEKEKQKKTYI
jgi:hypothetical protein